MGVTGKLVVKMNIPVAVRNATTPRPRAAASAEAPAFAHASRVPCARVAKKYKAVREIHTVHKPGLRALPKSSGWFTGWFAQKCRLPPRYDGWNDVLFWTEGSERVTGRKKNTPVMAVYCPLR